MVVFELPNIGCPRSFLFFLAKVGLGFLLLGMIACGVFLLKIEIESLLWTRVVVYARAAGYGTKQCKSGQAALNIHVMHSRIRCRSQSTSFSEMSARVAYQLT
jgi:hypothetical protein